MVLCFTQAPGPPGVKNSEISKPRLHSLIERLRKRVFNSHAKVLLFGIEIL
jgi:hypothetical protein